MSVTIRVKRGTDTQWAARTIPLLSGEFGYDITNKIVKIGDGTTLWSSLPTIGTGGGGSLTTEQIQDIIHTTLTDFVGIDNNITVTYDDDNNYIVLDTGPNVVLTDDLTAATGQTLIDANDYTDLAIAGLSDTVDSGYIPIGQKATAGGVASLDLDGYVPDTQISPDIARDSEIITSYNDLTDKPNIALAAVKWTPYHYQLNGGENTRYLAGDIVYDGGNIFVANFDNESLPTTNTQYWTNIGAGNRLNIDGRDIPNILWDNILEKPNLFDGQYSSLSGTPSIPADVSDLTDTTNLLVPFESPIFTGTVTTDDLIVDGDFTINGQNFAASATSIVIEDNMVQLAHENAANTVDLGIVVAYNDGTAKHAGIVRDVSDNKWKLFKGVTTEPSTTVDFSEGSFDDLQVAAFTASSITVGDVSNTEIQYLNGLTGGIQEQLDAKLSTDAAAIIYLGKIEAGLTYAPKSSPTFTGTVTFPENTSGANFVNIPNSALSNSSITINGSAVSLGGSTTIDALPSQSGNTGKYLTTDGSSTSWSTIDLSSKLDISEPSLDYYVTNAGAGAYVVNGVSNGTIYFEKGKKYRIHVNAAGHPFWIQTVSGGYSSGNVYNTGITNNGTQNGHIIVELPQDAPQLYYACQFHSSMAGSIVTGITTVIPLQTNQSGKYLTTNGTTTSWAEVSGGGGTAGADIMNIMEAW